MRMLVTATRDGYRVSCGIATMNVTAIFAKPEPVVMDPGFRRDDTGVSATQLPLERCQHRAERQQRGGNIQRI